MIHKKIGKKGCLVLGAISAVLVSGAALYCMYGEMRIPCGWLPVQARDFMSAHFPGEECIYAERDHDNGLTKYEVKLSGGAELDFTSAGDWEKVDCGHSFVPHGIVPEPIATDVSSRFPGTGIHEIERTNGGYEVKTGNGLELIYTADGTFARFEY